MCPNIPGKKLLRFLNQPLPANIACGEMWEDLWENTIFRKEKNQQTLEFAGFA